MTTANNKNPFAISRLVSTAVIACATMGSAFGAAPESPAVANRAIVPDRTVSSTTMSQKNITDQWLALWNGDLDVAKRLIAPDFALHATLLDGRPDTAIAGPAGLAAWVAQSHGFFSDLRFTVQVGPIVDGDFVVLRWVAVARYRGGIPGAGAAVGTSLRFTGTDILRMQAGKVKDYWLNADTGDLIMQLKLGQAAAPAAQ